MQLLVIDTETTSENPDEADCIEIACALVDTESRTTLWSCATLWCPPRFTTNEASHVNGISDAAILKMASHVPSWILGAIATASIHADAVVAHNARFDRDVLARMATQLDQPAPWNTATDSSHVRSILARPWVCALYDVRFPRQRSGRKLAYLAVDHGVQVTDGHRAAGDVRTLAELLLLCPDIDEQVADAQRPKKPYAAVVSYDARGDAKAAGFGWDPAVKLWTRRMTDRQLAQLLADHPQLVVHALSEVTRYNSLGASVAWLELGRRVELDAR